MMPRWSPRGGWRNARDGPPGKITRRVEGNNCAVGVALCPLGITARELLSGGRARCTACTDADSTSPRPGRGRSRPGIRPGPGTLRSSGRGRDRRARCTRRAPRPAGGRIHARSSFRSHTRHRWWFMPRARLGTRWSRLRSLWQETRAGAALPPASPIRPDGVTSASPARPKVGGAWRLN